MGATHLGTLRGFIEAAHLLQGNARWVIFLGGSCIRASFVDGVSQCRKKNRAFGHALAWALSLGGETSDLLLVADSKYAIGEVQAKQRCLFNVRLVHFIRGVWRAIAAIRPLPAIQERATMVTHEMSSLMFRQMLSIMATGFLWLLPELAVAPHPLLPILAQRILEPLPFHNSRRRRRFVAAKRCVASVHVLTLSPTEACRGGGLCVPARQAQLARSFAATQMDAIGLRECRPPRGQVKNVITYTCVYSDGPKS